MKQYCKWPAVVSVFFLVLFGVTACKKINIKETTTEDANIVDYMRKYPEKYSEFVKILDKTNVSPYLNAYGAYTVFAPNNDAIKTYLAGKGKASIDDIDAAALLDLVRLHIIQDTISTASFTDGKLSSPTMYGQFLVTGVSNKGTTVVNRQAQVVQSNILTGNGYIHELDNVLQPAVKTVAQIVEADPRYTIYTQALKATGLYDSLNNTNSADTIYKWKTFLAETDSVLRLSGINSYNDLVKKYNNTGNPKNPDDSLYLYMAYHILPGIKYVADIVTLPSHPTMAPLAVITTTYQDQEVLLNEANFNGNVEPGIRIDRPNSDNSATNGVVHALAGDIYLKVRLPIRVDFDPAAQPEIMKLTSIYRKAGKSVSFSLGQLADVTWQNEKLQAFTYYCNAATSSDNYWKDDGFSTNLRYGNAAANNWIEFVTPLIVKGRYKVWFCYRRAASGAYIQVSVDGVVLPRIIDFMQYNPDKNATDAVLESMGFKRYSSNNPNGNNVAQTAGVIDIATTDRHRLRLQAIKDAGSGANNSVTIDFIQFIPVNDDQTRPLYARDGSIVP